MATFSTSDTVTEVTPNAGLKEIIVTTPTTMINSDAITVVLEDYGISKAGLLTIQGYVQTTAGSVIAGEAPTTAVSSGTLTVTSPTGIATGARIYRILGKSN